jgi:short-subunit dehydrogenase
MENKKEFVFFSGPVADFFKTWTKSFIESKPYSLNNKTVVITGGSRGLGYAVAECFLKEGANVSILARDKGELIRAEMSLQRKFPHKDVLPVVCDVTDLAQVKEAFQRVRDRFGCIDVLVNNAGAIPVGSFQSMDTVDFEAQMKLHFYAPLNAINEVMPYFKSNGGGRIVNISSVGGKIPVPHMSPYCASKFALAGLSETLRAELLRDKVYITTVYPGLMRTGSQIQAVFKGDHQKEFAWFTVLGSLPGMTVSAPYAAHKIVKAVKRGQSQLIISLPANLGVLAHSLFPNLTNGFLAMVAERLPQMESHQRHTGAESQQWLADQKWSGPILKMNKKDQRQFNQSQKFDGDFNLGVATAAPKPMGATSRSHKSSKPQPLH